MSEQPPVQPPSTPPHQPSNEPAGGNSPTGGNPPTQPMAPGYSAPPVGPTASFATGYPPAKTSGWRQATSTSGRRVALALSAAAVALLLLLGIGVTGLVVLRNHDRVDLLGNRQDDRFLGQNGPGNGNGNGFGNGQRPGAKDRTDRRNLPGMPGGRGQGLGGLGNLLGGGALHGDVTANVGGAVQALVFQRGEVTALSDTSVTLKSTDGFEGTYGRNAATTTRGVALVKGGQAFVLARASDKVAITTLAMPATVGSLPSN
jgi:hypothetical protein